MIKHDFGSHSLRNSLRSLANEFLNWEVDSISNLRERISSKDSTGIPFQPYIPFVGKYYHKLRIAIYATAQNLYHNDPLVDYYNNNKELQVMRLWVSTQLNTDNLPILYPNSQFTQKMIAIRPFENGLLPGLVAMYLIARDGKLKIPLNEVFHYCAATNFYKGSLQESDSNGRAKDFNPNKKLNTETNADHKKWHRYHSELVDKELEAITPDIILSFDGLGYQHLVQRVGANAIIKVNDPSWLLRPFGGMKYSRPGSKWAKNAMKYATPEAIKTAKSIAKNVEGGKYSGESRKLYFETYLLKYHADFIDHFGQ